jgi:hypothetical protein
MSGGPLGRAAQHAQYRLIRDVVRGQDEALQKRRRTQPPADPHERELAREL